MTMEVTLPGFSLRFRPVRLEDGEMLARWRNASREMFFCRDVMTSDTHAAFMANQRPHDMTWVVETALGCGPVGWCGLRVDVRTRSAEDRILLVAPEKQGQGYGWQIEQMMLTYAFAVLRLECIWGDYYESNEPVARLHAKAGFRVYGRDIPGHTDPAGPVIHMGLWRNEWLERLETTQDGEMERLVDAMRGFQV